MVIFGGANAAGFARADNRDNVLVDFAVADVREFLHLFLHLLERTLADLNCNTQHRSRSAVHTRSNSDIIHVQACTTGEQEG